MLFENKEDASKAAKELNQSQIPGFENHIRVDLDVKGVLASQKEAAGEGEEVGEPNSKNDTDTTIFIGNLPFTVNEEDLRKHFTHL